MEYNIRFAKLTDCSTLSVVKRKVWETTYRGIYSDEKLDNYDYRKHKEKFIDIVNNKNVELYVVEVENEIIGYMECGMPIRPFSNYKQEIGLLYLLKEYQGYGIGKKLFLLGYSRIKEKGVNEFFISCNKYNVNGQKFYEKMGGKIIHIDEDNIDKSIPQVKFHYDIKTIQDIYLTIYNDKEIRNIYNQTNYLEENNYNGYAHHDFTHVCNVKDLAEKILKDLNYEPYVIEETKIAAIMHDIGAIQGKKDHAIRSWEFAKKYFIEKNIVLRDKDLVLDAIKNHSDGFDTDNVIRLALILADKLDVKSTRITKLGTTIEGNRQFKNIEDIKIEIENGLLKVKFITNKDFDKKELEEYYFMKKIGKAIRSFSEKFNLEYEVFLNEQVWNEIFEDGVLLK